VEVDVYPSGVDTVVSWIGGEILGERNMGEGSALSNCKVANIKAMRKELSLLEELNVGVSLRGN